MATADANGIAVIQDTDNLSPLHPVFNLLGQSVSNAFDANTRIWPVANETARSAKVTEIGLANITGAKPLFVWRANAPAGRNLEFSTNGTVWNYYSSSADDTGWVTIQTSTASRPLIEARNRGGWVEIFIDGFLSMPSGASVNILGAGGVPADFRPTKTNHRGVISTDARPSIAIANMNGSVVVVNNTGANRGAINASTIGYWIN